MQTNEFGYLVRGAKGLFYSDGRYFYFPNRGSNLKEGVIKNIRVVKDFLDDRGYAFIDAEMVETEPFSDKELLKMMTWASNVRRFKLGDSEVVLAFESGGLSDFNMFSKDLSSSGKVSAYIMHDDEKLLETYKDLDALGSVSFKKVEQKTIRAYAQELHINLSARSYESCCISDALSSKLFELGSNHYLVYAYNVDTVNVKALQDKKLNELVTQSSENYLSELKRYARNLTAKNIGSMTLQSWYFKQ